jgi:formylglycine-generating enzyme required for sulfatase activity
VRPAAAMDVPFLGATITRRATPTSTRLGTTPAASVNANRRLIVGAYPQGASSEGVLDLAGNVCEWCLNKHEHPEEIEPDTSGDARVLRGGSWYGNPESVRSAVRNWNDPGERVDNVGFRLVSSCPIR